MTKAKVATNFLALFLEKGFTILASFIVGIYVAVYLGAEDYGHLQYSINLSQLLIPLTSLGIANVVVKDLVQKGRRRRCNIWNFFQIDLIRWLDIGNCWSNHF